MLAMAGRRRAAHQRMRQLAPGGQLRLARLALAKEHDDELAVFVEQLDRGHGAVVGRLGHQPALVHGIAAPSLYSAILTKPPLAPGIHGVAGPKLFLPNVTDPMTALIFAARDSELLLLSVPAAALVPQVHLVP